MRSYIVVDIETTGVHPTYSNITEIGAIKVVGDQIEDQFDELINPLTTIPDQIVELTGITNDMVKECPTIEEVLPKFLEFAGDTSLPILGHNIMFDFSFIKYNAELLGMKFERHGLDTLKIARQTLQHLESRSLTFLCKYFQLPNENAHRALNDTLATNKIYQLLRKEYFETHRDLFSPKPLQWKFKKESPITDKQKKYLLSLLRQHGIQLEIHIDLLTKSEASKKIDEINFQYGRRA